MISHESAEVANNNNKRTFGAPQIAQRASWQKVAGEWLNVFLSELELWELCVVCDRNRATLHYVAYVLALLLGVL